MKYYVWSGDLKEIVTANNPDEAFLNAINKNDDKELNLGDAVLVSESGFEGEGEDAVILKTKNLIERLNIQDLFNFNEQEEQE